MLLPQFPECTESIAADVQIVRARSLRLLLERMKDVDRIRSRCHVEHAVCTANMNPDLTDCRSDGLHRFPVVRTPRDTLIIDHIERPTPD